MTQGEDERPADTPDEVTVRPARAGDREAVLAFCAHIWDGHDYLQYVWDDWLADEEGALLVAVVSGRPVGVVHMRLISEDEAWLEGIRVDPKVQGQGIGGMLTSRALVASREHGASVARLLTGADNAASQAIFTRFGFTRVAELLHYAAPPADAQVGITLATPGIDDFERIWEWLVHSNLASLNGGLELEGWAARALTEPGLRAYLAGGHVLLLEEWETIQALAVAVPTTDDDDDEPRVQVRYLDGLADAIGRLGLALRERAKDQGLAGVGLWLPDLLILRDAMDGAGYSVDGDGDQAFWIYARDL